MKAYAKAKVVIEAGTHSPWVSRLLAKLKFDVVVANPSRLKLISDSLSKTDRHDAEMLARLGRSDVVLLHPIQHRSEERQKDLDVLQARDLLVRLRTSVVNHVRGTAKAMGARLPACDADAFGGSAGKHVPKPLRPALLPMIAVAADLTEKIKAFDRQVEELGRKYPETVGLREVTGVGPLTSLAFVLVLGSAERFKRSRLVGSYLGLVPGVSQSGEHDPQLRITKAR